MTAEARCKACNISLSEESVYALGNDRWHVECFKCSTCKKKLTEEMNMLALGDGLLVCSDCSFSCAICAKKITDVAVLTNDKAYCATCFVCKKCKNKIEDLHYARTSQGIFCMSCHQLLLEHKRQRQKQKQLARDAQAAGASTAGNGTASSGPNDGPNSGSTDGAGTAGSAGGSAPPGPGDASGSTNASESAAPSGKSETSAQYTSAGGRDACGTPGPGPRASTPASPVPPSKDVGFDLRQELNSEWSSEMPDGTVADATYAHDLKGSLKVGLNKPAHTLADMLANTSLGPLSRLDDDRGPETRRTSPSSSSASGASSADSSADPALEPRASSQPASEHIARISQPVDGHLSLRPRDGSAPPVPARSRSGSAVSRGSARPSPDARTQTQSDVRAQSQGPSDARPRPVDPSSAELKHENRNATFDDILRKDSKESHSSSSSASVGAPLTITENNSSEPQLPLSPDKNIRYPRKKLAPSAFQNDDSSEFPGAGGPLAVPPVPSRSIPGPPLPAPTPNGSLAPPLGPNLTISAPLSAPTGYAHSAHSSTSSLPPLPGTPQPADPDVPRSDPEISVPLRSVLRPSSPNAGAFGEDSSVHEALETPKKGVVPRVHRKTSSLNSGGEAATPSPGVMPKSPVPVRAKPTHSLSAQSLNNQGSKSPFSRLLRKRNGESPTVAVPVISNPTNFHKRSVSDNSADGAPTTRSNSNGSLSNMSSNASTLANMSVTLGQPGAVEFNENEIDETKLTQGIRRLRDEYRILAKRNMQLIELNQELDRQIAEKLAAHPGLTVPSSYTGPGGSAPGQASSVPAAVGAPTAPAAGNAAASGTPGAPTAQPPPPPAASAAANEKPFVTVLQDIQQREPQHPLAQLRSTKNWLFRRPHRSNELPANLAGASGSNAAGGAGNSAASEASAQQARPEPVSLIEVAQKDKRKIPYFVTRCLDEVERRGLSVVGIYRKPGSKPQVDLLLKYYSADGDSALGEQLISSTEIHTVTSAVKQYLRRFSEPVVPFDCYDTFIAAGNSKQLPVLQKALAQLPPEHFATLRLVMAHLATVASHETQNLMNTRNLAMVFAPTLTRDESGDREVPDMQAREDATHLLLLNQQQLLRDAV